ncbi:DNA-binding transcriptional regulator, FadR family [Bauldia litoralis]|uniref:DNA-binding transcriptional regulator, FadR family n=1 Tax=Bauldia litoralis TaxID=665467 RepID=A0A1G6BTY9_9HYPH|nr:DNA-binding transcriptional regulator, FadR family [Bauldia litoralis]
MTVSSPTSKRSDVDHIVSAIKGIQADSGTLPSERDLAERLNVKRHQLRKALAILRQSGDLMPAPARRPSTALPRYSEELVRMTNPLEVLELRLMMEPGLARLASLRASALEIARITHAATTPDDAAAGAVDLAFHLAIATGARNHLANEFYKMLRQVGVDARVRIASDAPVCPRRVGERDAEHRLIAEAIAQRDPEAAEAAMRAHLLSVQKRINARSNAGAVAA